MQPAGKESGFILYLFILSVKKIMSLKKKNTKNQYMNRHSWLQVHVVRFLQNFFDEKLNWC